MFWVYILRSFQKKSYYVGSCEDLNTRIALHNQGLVKSTRRYCPWEVIFKEKFHTLQEARKRELQIKSWKKRSAIEKLARTFQNS